MNEASHGSVETLRRCDGLLTAGVDDELLMMSVDKGKYFNLNNVGTAIWNLLEVPRSVDQLVEALTAQFDVTADTARPEVIEFIVAMRDRGLVQAT